MASNAFFISSSASANVILFSQACSYPWIPKTIPDFFISFICSLDIYNSRTITFSGTSTIFSYNQSVNSSRIFIGSSTCNIRLIKIISGGSKRLVKLQFSQYSSYEGRLLSLNIAFNLSTNIIHTCFKSEAAKI